MTVGQQQAVFFHVPRTGGTTLGKILEGLLLRTGHANYESTRSRYLNTPGSSTPWEKVYKFTMIRNPWSRYLSLFAYRTKQLKLEFTHEDFTKWLTLNTSLNLSAGELLSGHEKELDYIGMFESYADSVVQITTDLAEELDTEIYLDYPIPHANASPHNYDDWRPYYTDHTYRLVAELGAWEIERYDYGFDDYVFTKRF